MVLLFADFRVQYIVGPAVLVPELGSDRSSVISVSGESW